MAPPSMSRRTYQLIALATLPLPGVATWLAAPYAVALVEGASPAGPLKVLAVVLVLLVAVLAWGALLLPLRRRAGFPGLGAEVAAAGSLGEAWARAQAEQRALAAAGPDRPDLRRRHHLGMAAGGAVVALATGVGTFAMLYEGGARVFLWLPVAAVVSVVLAVYHLARGLLIRVPR